MKALMGLLDSNDPQTKALIADALRASKDCLNCTILMQDCLLFHAAESEFARTQAQKKLADCIAQLDQHRTSSEPQTNDKIEFVKEVCHRMFFLFTI